MPIRAWNTPGIWSLTASQQAEAVPQLICLIQAAVSPSFPLWHTPNESCYSHKHRTSTPQRAPRGSQPTPYAVPEGFPQAISTNPLCPHRHVPVINAIPCGTGLFWAAGSHIWPVFRGSWKWARIARDVLTAVTCLKAWILLFFTKNLEWAWVGSSLHLSCMDNKA